MHVVGETLVSDQQYRIPTRDVCEAPGFSHQVSEKCDGQAVHIHMIAQRF